MGAVEGQKGQLALVRTAVAFARLFPVTPSYVRSSSEGRPVLFLERELSAGTEFVSGAHLAVSRQQADAVEPLREAGGAGVREIIGGSGHRAGEERGPGAQVGRALNDNSQARLPGHLQVRGAAAQRQGGEGDGHQTVT